MTPIPTPTSTPVPLVCVKFFYDGNMSGSRDETEPFLSPIVKGYQQSQDGCYYVPEGKETRLYITGKAPNGKDLLNATLDWPMGVNLLPQITVDTTKTREIGLVDGFCSSPIRPEDLYHEEYKKFEENPASWFDTYTRYYTGAKTSPNWLFYGYNINWNEPGKGLKEHLAFDIWGKDGTPVHAPVPGAVVNVFQNAINIKYTQGRMVNLGHIKPVLEIGRKVRAGELVGYVIGPEGNHVHMELIPNGGQILYCFPGLSPNDLLINPTQGPHPVLPYFGR
jgi:murein DD-endopeptidase MepM/ murein hydrolase activator NlpD